VSAPFRRRRDGRYAVRLDPAVRAVLVTLAEQLAPGMDPGEPSTRRLFPPAYPGQADRGAEREYRALVDDALVNHHRQAMAVVVATADQDVLGEEEINAWLSAIGSMRLVIGTRLDVSEEMDPPDPEDPAAPEYALYELLGQLQFLIVEVLAGDLPDEGRVEGVL